MMANSNSNYKQSYAAIVIIFASLTTLAYITQSINCYYIVVDEGKQDCYHEYANASTKLGFSFEVLGEGANDIDITIKDPAKVIVHQEKSIESGKYTIEAGTDGNYEVCFINRESRGQLRYVMFNIDATQKQKEVDTADHQVEYEIATMARNLHISTLTAKHEATYLVQRDKIHKNVSESTNATIARWVLFESIILLAVSLVQVWYVRRFFETRRKV